MRKISATSGLNFRIPVAGVLLALSCILLVTVVAWDVTKEAVVETTHSRLNLIASAHRDGLLRALAQVDDDVVALSVDSRFTANASALVDAFDREPLEHRAVMRDFTSAATVEERLSRDEPDIPTTYGRRHVRLHEAVRRLMQHRRYADVLIVDMAGRIVYTATKSADFGGNVAEARFADTALPLLVERLGASRDGNIATADFMPYAIGGARRSGFVGVPFVRRADVAMGTAQPTVRIGYLIVRIDERLLEEANASRSGLGETGRIVVTGPDGVVRGTTSPLATMAAISAAAEREHFFDSVTVPALQALWTIRAEQDLDEAMAGLDRLLIQLFLGGGLVALLAMAAAVHSARSLVRPLVQLTRTLERLARREWTADIPGIERHDEIGAIARAVVRIRDVTAEKAQAEAEAYRSVSEENERLANLDHLTNLANRRGFMAQAERLRGECPKGRRVLLMLMDLDGFKQVNDTFGHAAGDRLLEEVARRLRTVLGPEALLGRLGGDEFVALLSDLDRERACRYAAEVIDAVARDVEVDRSVTVAVGISIGLFEDDPSDIALDHALHCADLALYAAKTAGKSTFRLHGAAMEGEVRRRKQIETELRSAVETGIGLSLHYQPIVDAATRAVTSREALLRWTSPLLGEVSPGEFIPIAEESDLIRKIGSWVLWTACREAQGWQDGCPVAINLSPAELGDGEIARSVLDSGLGPARLHVEITETALLDEKSGRIADMRQLRAIGVKVVLDDFGVGYSSLAHIRCFPFDKIKIDGSFVRDAVERPDCAAIVGVLADLGARLGIPVVAEGVETEAQLAYARACGCKEIQGFLIGRPARLPARDGEEGLADSGTGKPSACHADGPGLVDGSGQVQRRVA